MTDMPTESTQRVFQTVDAMQPDNIAALFAEDARMVFGNADPLVGREAITAGVQGFFSTINGLQHQIVNEWHIGADTIAETEVTYRRLDDKNVTIPVVSIWHTRDGLIDDYRVLFDLTPVYAP
jgi:ketosteroid isomerase-like protein